MKRESWLLIALILTVATTPARAAAFERDWKMPGDGLLTYDDVNQREWLDVPQTLLANFPGADLEAAYQSVVNETSPGGLFERFTVAKSADVIALAQSAGIDVNTASLAVNEVATRHLVQLLGPTHEFVPNNSIFLRGMVSELAADCNCRIFAGIGSGPSGAGIGFLSIAQDNNDRPSNFTGVMLFRQVPEPSTWLTTLAGTSFLLATASRFARK